MARLREDQATRLARGIAGIVGNHVVIDHGGGEYSQYAHLRPGSVRVRVGQSLRQGDVIGALGSSGNSTEPHLHFQVCDSADPLVCVGIPPNWKGLGLAGDPLGRDPQTGDFVSALPAAR
jgi:murein DD-endopeptidase MepM/ murein hydrolase activator NlpD